MKLRLEDIIKVASDAYPDGLVGSAFDGEKVGDTLAEFIANELRDTFEGENDVEQIANASQAMYNAINELKAVSLALHRLVIELAQIDGIPKKDLPLYVNEEFEFEVAKEHYAKRLKG
jgi:hypothetical protein